MVGLEAIMNAVVRSTKGKLYMGKTEVLQLLERCYANDEFFAREEGGTQ